jgi:hypothetical protein
MPLKHFICFVIFITALGVTPALAETAAPTVHGWPYIQRGDYERVLANPGNEDVFQEFLNKLPKVKLSDAQGTHTYYLLEGDLLQTEQQVRAFVYGHAAGAISVAPRGGELLVMTQNGIRIFWPRGQRRLTYAIDRGSFPSQDTFDTVAANFAAAAQAWVDACPTCGLSFEHVSAFDNAANAGDVTFIVKYSPDETSFIAASFFPNDPDFRRLVLIAPLYFTTTFDKVGVFRHEIGHILGYRHEQNVGVPGCVVEDNDWTPLTAYDALSVMHYVCGGRGSLSLQLTDSDKAGHQELYK